MDGKKLMYTYINMLNFPEKGGARKISYLLEEFSLENHQKHYTTFLDIHQKFKNGNPTYEITPKELGGYKLGLGCCRY